MYSAGCNIIAANVEQDTQKNVASCSRGITAMAIASDRRLYAVAEKAKPGATGAAGRPSVTVYEVHTWKKRRGLTAAESCLSQEFVSLCFSYDSRYLAAQSGGPDWMLHYYSWEKGKTLATLKLVPNATDEPADVTDLTINPIDETEMCIIMRKTANVYRYKEGALTGEPLYGIHGHSITCGAWLPPPASRLALGTESGQILIVDRGVIMQTITDLPPISAILGLTPGFAVAAKGGALRVFDKFNADREGKDVYKLTRQLTVPEESDVRSLTGNAAEGVLVIETVYSQMFRFILTEQRGLKSELPKFVPLTEPFHFGSITSMDVCVRRTIVATCAEDSSIRVWDYEQKECLFAKFCNEEPLSVALHPSGQHMLVGFSDKLRMMNVLVDDLHPFREFGLRGCRECKFSSGGQFFAAAHGNMIHIFSTWTCDNIASLKGHNGRVRSLNWTPDDAYLVSAGADGAVYAWNMIDFKRENEYILKNTSYSSAIISSDGKTMWVVGNDKKIKEINESSVVMDVETDEVLTQLAMSRSGRMLFAGKFNAR
ncbi:WD40-repeat-containing domain protein [Fimicolochytrium jonesii]|uniref:WD40-repeat-containing domain protein n=1 Tax=Fimicolochytrium jonesii TaxID=1396493 RepID=UPI0022FF4117|nr:WD40-repeat-containing domain protein [Fimicolochytrium jonesii]KAI8822024.1 WD40-repeat-containing domain protein [Fimicolochytrium jonesii]